MPPAEPQPACTICQGPLRLFGPRLEYEYHECLHCGSLQLWPMPTPETLQAAYAEQYADACHTQEFDDPEHWQHAGAPYRQNLIDALIRQHIHGPIIDFGAGWGHLLSDMQTHGIACQGVELSARMADHAKAQGLPIRQGGFDLIEADPIAPAGIVLCAVFEHLSDHHQWMQRFNRRLPPGGYLISLHPTAACYRLLGQLIRLGRRQKPLPELHGSFAPPWHTLLISLQGMAQLAQQHGFATVAIYPASQGRAGGLIGLIQRMLELTNRLGVGLFGLRWPGVTTHVFVLKKMREDTQDSRPA